MDATAHVADALDAIRHLTIDQIEARLAEIDAERAALSRLRRSLVARDRARRRADRHQTSTVVAGGRADG